MSGAEPPVGTTGGSSESVPSLLQQEGITAVQLSDAILELIKQQQEITAVQLSNAIREIARQQQQQEVIAADRSQRERVRGWLTFVVTLTASITYSAALNPPGGVWQADDAENRQIAGRPVLLDKFPAQYFAFFYANAMSFAMSLCIIILLSSPSLYGIVSWSSFSTIIALDIFAWAGAFVAGSSTSWMSFITLAPLVFGVLAYMAFRARSLLHPRNPQPGDDSERVAGHEAH